MIFQNCKLRVLNNGNSLIFEPFIIFVIILFLFLGENVKYFCIKIFEKLEERSASVAKMKFGDPKNNKKRKMEQDSDSRTDFK